ncbi:MAG: carbon-nitrogen hydrolase family protein [Actinobacteria bacterium]|nr:carbon-nitrogen hydrolase family protein [Actinomycetota bacterium]
MKDKFKIAVCQLKVSEDKTRNLNIAAEMIAEAAGKKAGIVVLPEMFNCPYDREFFPLFAEKYPGITTGMLSSLAKKYSVYIIGGSIPELESKDIFNTSFVFDSFGKLIARHRKIHLFDVCVKGGICFQESSVIKAGSEITVFDTKYCKAGVAICYDIRFPELLRKMTLFKAELIIIPAAFNMTTGPAHWHITARTRALDNQVYLALASPARDYKASYTAFGHSLIVNPWGEILSEAGTSKQIIYADIDLKYLKKIRNELPLLRHRKLDF